MILLPEDDDDDDSKLPSCDHWSGCRLALVRPRSVERTVGFAFSFGPPSMMMMMMMMMMMFVLLLGLKRTRE